MSLTKADGQVISITATDVGLGNVTNESKATMFTDPAFTGTVDLSSIRTSATNLTIESGLHQGDPGFTRSKIELTNNGFNDYIITNANYTHRFFVGSTNTFSIPGTVGTNGGVLTTDGAGSCSWTALQSFNNPTFTGTTTLQQTTEVINTKTGATGTVEHDFSTGNIWWHTTPAANFTVNITNVPTTDNRAIKVVIAMVQNAGSAFYPNALQIDGVAYTISWQFNQFPAPIANKIEFATFLLVRVGGSWVVLGHWNSY